MADISMAKVVWAPGISTVSGALVKIDKKSPHAADQQMLLATHRTAPTMSKKCNNLYLRGLQSVTRSTPVTADEQVIRTRFAAVARAVAVRKKDLAHVASDLAAFNAQKETGYPTLKSYLWSVCAAIYDQNNG